ncbi:hypothetical protein GGR54DRAFT_590111 [Hypoxylon sp. NC1633]|nr:hypothetical protein GGR54DRAFT_590111 [Hypoxylon sp. NC1633]
MSYLPIYSRVRCTDYIQLLTIAEGVFAATYLLDFSVGTQAGMLASPQSNMTPRVGREILIPRMESVLFGIIAWILGLSLLRCYYSRGF